MTATHGVDLNGLEGSRGAKVAGQGSVSKPVHRCPGLRIRRLGVRVPPSAPRLTSGNVGHLTICIPRWPGLDRNADRNAAAVTILPSAARTPGRWRSVMVIPWALITGGYSKPSRITLALMQRSLEPLRRHAGNIPLIRADGTAPPPAEKQQRRSWRRGLGLAVVVVLAGFSAGALVSLALPGPRHAVVSPAEADRHKSAASKVGAAAVTPALRIPFAAAVTVVAPAAPAGPVRRAGPAVSHATPRPSPRTIVGPAPSPSRATVRPSAPPLPPTSPPPTTTTPSSPPPSLNTSATSSPATSSPSPAPPASPPPSPPPSDSSAVLG